MSFSDPPVRKLVSLLYLAGGLILVDQGFDITASLLAASAGSVTATWRFGAFGLVVARLPALLVADAFLFAAALRLGHHLALRILGLGHLIFAAAGLVALVLFGLDALEVQGRARGELEGPVRLAALRAAGTVILLVGLTAWAAVVALRATRRHRHRSHSEGPPLVTHQPRGSARP